MSKQFSVYNLLQLPLKDHNVLELEYVGTHIQRMDFSRLITVPDLNRPGLALSGFFDSFASERIQIFGQGECAYLEKLIRQEQFDTLEKMFSYDNIPCCIFSHGYSPSEQFLSIAEASGCPILKTKLKSTELSQRLMHVLAGIFASKKIYHGVLVEVYGLGIFITGPAGIGKSEVALDLIDRGHCIISDDSVSISRTNGNVLTGRRSHDSFLDFFIEVRGIGVVNITRSYGLRSVLEKTEIQLVAKLVEWDRGKRYTDGMEYFEEIIGVQVPCLEIPVKPGRNIPIILETAAIKARLERMGYSSGREFRRSAVPQQENNYAITNPYYFTDDIY